MLKTNETTATARPWQAVPAKLTGREINSAETIDIRTGPQDGFPKGMLIGHAWRGGKDTQTLEANAALIVQAVNSFDAATALAEQAGRYLHLFRGHKQGDCGPMCSICGLRSALAAFEQARGGGKC